MRGSVLYVAMKYCLRILQMGREVFDWQISNMKFGCCAKKLRDEADTVVSGYILQNPHESNTIAVCSKIQQRCTDMTFL